jgi:hypothetical protein
MSFGIYSLPNLADLDLPESTVGVGAEPDFNGDGSYSGGYGITPVRAANGVFNDAGRAVAVPANPDYQGLEPSPEYQGRVPAPVQTQAIAGGVPAGSALQVDAAEPVSAAQGKTRGLGIAATQPLPVNQSVNVVEMNREENPGVQDKIERTVRKATNADLQRMLNQFAVLDWAEGKINAGQLQDQVEKARIYQAEGFARAASMALTGNTKQAMKMFAEHGSDDGSEVDSLVVEKITKDIPGAKAKDIYNGLRIKYKDGEQMLFDPKDFLVQTASLKAMLDSRSTNENLRRDDEIKEQQNRNTANALSQSRQDRLDQKEREAEDRRILASLNLSRTSAKADLEFGKELVGKEDSPQYIIDPKKRQEALTKLEEKVQLANLVTENNIYAGNTRASYGLTSAALKNPTDLVVVENKRVVRQDSMGHEFYVHKNGTLIPTDLFGFAPPQGASANPVPGRTAAVPPPAAPRELSPEIKQLRADFDQMTTRRSSQMLRGNANRSVWESGSKLDNTYQAMKKKLEAAGAL